MIRSILILLAVGFVGLIALGLVLSLAVTVLFPLLVILLKLALIAAAGYLILRLVRPDLADECRAELRRRFCDRAPVNHV